VSKRPRNLVFMIQIASEGDLGVRSVIRMCFGGPERFRLELVKLKFWRLPVDSEIFDIEVGMEFRKLQ